MKIVRHTDYQTTENIYTHMVEFNGVKYSYAYNLQGDVIGIVDNAGNLVIEYNYSK